MLLSTAQHSTVIKAPSKGLVRRSPKGVIAPGLDVDWPPNRPRSTGPGALELSYQLVLFE